MTIQHQHEEMTDAEIAVLRIRTDRFIDDIGNAITEAIDALDPESGCTFEARRGLARISATLRDVDYVDMANLATLDQAMKNRVGTGLMLLIEAALMTVGTGPSADYESAAEFMKTFAPLIDEALKLKRRKVN